VRGAPPRLPLLLAAAAAALALTHTGEIRERAERALGAGMPPREAALARGFVLGEDDGVDPLTTEDFRRSGLAHLLAVSGQNVALLALLAMPLLAALGMPLRTRLLWILAVIAVYVPLAGAGPSIQRAGIMGALSVLATLTGRRASRLYALAFAAVVLLAIEPGIAADVGWQLSFAAVLGILLLARPLGGAIAAGLGGGRGWRRALADAAAMTIAATLATVPLIAYHFEAVSTLTLVANLLALPAVAPAMWLGMLVAAAGQIPGFPVGVLNALAAPLLAYIAQVAAWCGRPTWAYPHVHLGLAGLIASYAVLATAAAIAASTADGPKTQLRVAFSARRRTGWGLAAGLGVAVALALPAGGAGGSTGAPVAGLRISVLDVGQGDAILLQPVRAPAILVDGGPPGGGLVAELRAAGVERLGAVLVTHDQSDHAGGVPELLGAMPVGQLLYGVLGRPLGVETGAAGVPIRRVARGSELRSGSLRLEVLWPPHELLAERQAGEDPNRLAIVALARWRRFSMLLTADVEAEAVPLDAGPVDVLKVAHHGSEDAGLGSLLDRLRPRLATISVGAGNPFGHPAEATLGTLAAHGVPVLRTDREGTIVLDVTAESIEAHGSD
jgi:competence protein ComEC